MPRDVLLLAAPAAKVGGARNLQATRNATRRRSLSPQSGGASPPRKAPRLNSAARGRGGKRVVPDSPVVPDLPRGSDTDGQSDVNALGLDDLDLGTSSDGTGFTDFTVEDEDEEPDLDADGDAMELDAVDNEQDTQGGADLDTGDIDSGEERFQVSRAAEAAAKQVCVARGDCCR